MAKKLTLTLSDENGVVVDEWTTDDSMDRTLFEVLAGDVASGTLIGLASVTRDAISEVLETIWAKENDE